VNHTFYSYKVYDVMFSYDVLVHELFDYVFSLELVLNISIVVVLRQFVLSNLVPGVSMRWSMSFQIFVVKGVIWNV
jgi:hypothetical protein